MPTISPVARAVIGATPEEQFRQPRASVQASTGMEITRQEKPAGQPSTTEDTDPKAVTLSPQLTALARKQQKLQQEIQAQREREAAFTAKESDYIPKSAFKDKVQKDALGALKELGLDYEELTNLMLAQQQGADPVKELKAELQSLKASQEQNINKQYDATLKQYRAEADSLISQDPKAYHFITKTKNQAAVVQHIVETWEENPEKILTVEQAAKDIEEFLREQAREAKAALEELDGPPTEPAPQKKLPPPSRTLTNQAEAAPAKKTYGQFQHMSMKERIAQAMARAQK